jgi:hypothetical protein
MVDLADKTTVVGLGRWIALSAILQGTSMALLLGLMAVAFDIPATRLLVPYCVLVSALLTLSTLVHWTWGSYGQPHYARRFGSLVFVSMALFQLAAAFTIRHAGLVSLDDVSIIGVALSILGVSAAIAGVTYYRLRKSSSRPWRAASPCR